MVSTISTWMAILLALAVWPGVLWLAYRKIGMHAAGAAAMLTGPLWFGWWLGMCVLIVPGASLALYWACMLLPPLAGIWLLRRVQAVVPTDPGLMAQNSQTVATVLGIGVGVWFFLQSAAYPTDGHDALVMQLFAADLAHHWNYWSLPRYQPNDRGFFYALTHPPAMSALIAWLKAHGADGWQLRLPFAVLAFGLPVGLVRVVGVFSTRAAVFALLLLLSMPFFLTHIIDNAQDIFRHAALVGFLLVFFDRGIQSSRRRTILGGALLGLGAAYHNLQVPFVVFFPAAIGCIELWRKRFPKKAAVLLACGLVVAAYPYIGNKLATGHWIIKQGQRFEEKIDTVNSYRKSFHPERHGADLGFRQEIRQRSRHVVGLNRAGVTGLSVIVCLLLLGWRMWRRGGQSQDDEDLLTLGLAWCAFAWLILDPGNVIYDLTRKAYWTNGRYPETVYPIAVVLGSVFWAQCLGRRRILRWIAVAGLATFVVYASGKEIRLDAKLVQRHDVCLFCSDREKLMNDNNGPYVVLDWLQQFRPDSRCLTFREGKYFGWTSLSGLVHYTPTGERFMSANTADQALAALQAAGLNCVYVTETADGLENMKMVAPHVEAVRNHPRVQVFQANWAEIWLVEAAAPATSTPTTLPVAEAPKGKFIFELPAFIAGEVELHFPDASEKEIFARLKSPPHQWKVVRIQAIATDQYRISLLGYDRPARLVVKFEPDIQLREATFRSIQLPSIVE